mgnify:CR=1 FL=1
MVDSMPWHMRSWEAFAREMGGAALDAEFVRKTSGMTGIEVMRAHFGDRPEPELKAMVHRKERLYRDMFEPVFAEVRGFMAFARAAREAGIKLACATAGDRDNIRFVHDNLDCHDLFDAVVGAHDVERGKPHPDLFLLAASRVGVYPAECLVFEDAAHGIEAARRAGMRAVAIATMIAPEVLGAPEHVIASAVDFTALDPAALVARLASR